MPIFDMPRASNDETSWMTDTETMTIAPVDGASPEAPAAGPMSTLAEDAASISETGTAGAIESPAVSASTARVDTGSDGWLDAAMAQASGIFDAGGPVVVILAGLSILAAAIVILKLWQFQRLRLGRARPIDEALGHWYRDDAEAALAAVAGRRQPVARVVHLALAGLCRPGVDLATLREELVRVAGAQIEQLRSYLRTLEIIGTLSPLLGLLGTVLGMIEAFRQMEAVGSQVDPAVLSGGIWEALLTTAVGLSVAIPVVLMHSWLERRVDRCGHQMEDAVTRVFTRGLSSPTGQSRDHGAAMPSVEVGYAA